MVFDEFGEYPARRPGMQEGHHVASESAPGRGVNQFDALICQFTKRGLQMGNGECHMMHARALLG